MLKLSFYCSTCTYDYVYSVFLYNHLLNHTFFSYILLCLIFLCIMNNYLYWSCINNFGTYLLWLPLFLIGSSKAALDMLTKVHGVGAGSV